MESLQNHRWNAYATKFTPRVYSVGFNKKWSFGVSLDLVKESKERVHPIFFLSEYVTLGESGKCLSEYKRLVVLALLDKYNPSRSKGGERARDALIGESLEATFLIRREGGHVTDGSLCDVLPWNSHPSCRRSTSNPEFVKKVRKRCGMWLRTRASRIPICGGGWLNTSISSWWDLSTDQFIVYIITSDTSLIEFYDLIGRIRGAFDSAKNHKRQRRKRQSVTAKRERSQTPKFV